MLEEELFLKLWEIVIGKEGGGACEIKLNSII